MDKVMKGFMLNNFNNSNDAYAGECFGLYVEENNYFVRS